MKKKFNFKKIMEQVSDIEWLKESQNYLKSEENLKRCEPFEKLNQKYITLQNKYSNLYHELSKNIESNVYRREYAKGGINLHRGFYSPSAMDLVTKNCTRGRLLKKLPINNNYDYEYLFDIQNKLVSVYSYSNFEGVAKLATIELFIYKQNTVLSLIFNSDNSHDLSFISECQYHNSVLTRYENAVCELFYGGKGCTEINVETFQYESSLLSSFCWYNYMPCIHVLTQREYFLNRDEKGFFSTYLVNETNGLNTKENFNHSILVNKVNAKRK